MSRLLDNTITQQVSIPDQQPKILRTRYK